jgi:hypothetical protein
MEHEGSLPCSQNHSAGPYPEPDQSSPYHPILSLRSILILSPTYVWVFLVVSFILVFPLNTICVPLLPHACHMPWPSHLPRLDHSNYTWRRVRVMKLLIMQFFFNLLSLHPFLIQIFSSAPCSQTPTDYVLPLMSKTKFHTHIKPKTKL